MEKSARGGFQIVNTDEQSVAGYVFALIFTAIIYTDFQYNSKSRTKTRVSSELLENGKGFGKGFCRAYVADQKVVHSLLRHSPVSRTGSISVYSEVTTSSFLPIWKSYPRLLGLHRQDHNCDGRPGIRDNMIGSSGGGNRMG